MPHTLFRSQILDTSLDEAWKFLRTPSNLNELTPDDLDFEILSDLPDEMYDGLIIQYRIKLPLIGRRMWVTEIKHVRPMESFVDEQRIGPYKLWYHRHELEQLEDGRVRASDHVTYAIPGGPIGDIVHTLYIKRKLAEIFDYRERRMEEIFGRADGTIKR